MDHYRTYIRKRADDRHYATVSKIATAFWGLYAMVFAGFGG